jgi:hypothetical protein
MTKMQKFIQINRGDIFISIERDKKNAREQVITEIITVFSIISFGDFENSLAIVGGIIIIPNNIRLPINFMHTPIVILTIKSNIASIDFILIPLEIAKSLFKISKIIELKLKNINEYVIKANIIINIRSL